MNSSSSSTFCAVPPGFRFHPTDEELVDYYLRKKINCRRIDLDVIRDVDLYKIEPWDLQELCRIGSEEEQSEWYFFSHKDKKYPTGTRTNRATTAGFWKATGRDKAIYTKNELIGMRKTLVFYKGRAPNGQKSDWIMHEYRLETNENPALQEEGWVVCRVFKKKITTVRKKSDHDPSPCLYDLQPAPSLDHRHHQSWRSIFEMDGGDRLHRQQQQQAGVVDSVMDWRVLDKFVASQLSLHDDDHQLQRAAGGGKFSNAMASSTSCATTSSSLFDLWK